MRHYFLELNTEKLICHIRSCEMKPTPWKMTQYIFISLNIKEAQTRPHFGVRRTTQKCDLPLTTP